MKLYVDRQKVYDGVDGDDKVKDVVSRTLCSCKRLIDHMVVNSTTSLVVVEEMECSRTMPSQLLQKQNHRSTFKK